MHPLERSNKYEFDSASDDCFLPLQRKRSTVLSSEPNNKYTLNKTFRKAPHNFYQCLIVVVFNQGTPIYVSCVYGLVTTKNEYVYCEFHHQMIVLIEYRRRPKIKKLKISNQNPSIILSKIELLIFASFPEINLILEFLKRQPLHENNFARFLVYLKPTWRIHFDPAKFNFSEIINIGIGPRINITLERCNRQ
ncbi:hypothetical protein HZS_4769 [Henneguya salminicola]|nr:hypothetical protein HZS_4769 [Henneguya salminicola]